MKFWIIYKLPHETTWLTMSTDTKEKMDDYIRSMKQSGFEAKFSHVTQNGTDQRTPFNLPTRTTMKIRFSFIAKS